MKDVASLEDSWTLLRRSFQFFMKDVASRQESWTLLVLLVLLVIRNQSNKVGGAGMIQHIVSVLYLWHLNMFFSDF
jgi:hypothetical protein